MWSLTAGLVVFQCRFYYVDLRRVAVLEQWSLKPGGLLIQVVSNTDLTVLFVIDIRCDKVLELIYYIQYSLARS